MQLLAELTLLCDVLGRSQQVVSVQNAIIVPVKHEKHKFHFVSIRIFPYYFINEFRQEFCKVNISVKIVSCQPCVQSCLEEIALMTEVDWQLREEGFSRQEHLMLGTVNPSCCGYRNGFEESDYLRKLVTYFNLEIFNDLFVRSLVLFSQIAPENIFCYIL